MNQAVEYGNDPESTIKMVILKNEIEEATCKASIDPEIHLTDVKKKSTTIHSAHIETGGQGYKNS